MWHVMGVFQVKSRDLRDRTSIEKEGSRAVACEEMGRKHSVGRHSIYHYIIYAMETASE